MSPFRYIAFLAFLFGFRFLYFLFILANETRSDEFFDELICASTDVMEISEEKSEPSAVSSLWESGDEIYRSGS